MTPAPGAEPLPRSRPARPGLDTVSVVSGARRLVTGGCGRRTIAYDLGSWYRHGV